MKNFINKILLGSTIVLIIILSIFLPYEVVPGVYVNTNFEGSMIPPLRPDTLIIHENGHIESSFFGDATYELQPAVFSTTIIIYYGYRSSFHSDVKGIWFNSPKIIVFRDANHYYKKILPLPAK